ncbi:MAG: MaoC/PaaZ C-terminal domain-containing protein [Actinomycetota bacterium]
MPIEPDKAVGAEFPEGQASWEPDDVILYHLGVGAGAQPTDPAELEYTYEANLKVLPSFGVIPVFGALGGLFSVPGLTFNPVMLLHGEQDIEIADPIPTQAKVVSSGRIANIYDKGKGAVVVIESNTTDDAGKALFTNRFSVFLRGEGGFGGERGPEPGNVAPDREPDRVVESPTLPQQALLYRLSGDKNPLHADPNFAAMGGFEKPILHGLCTFGVACKAAVDHELGGDVSRVARYQVRFSGHVFPGETIVTSMWREDDKLVLQATTKERGLPVLTNAAITLR